MILAVVTGPTASGKTAAAISLARTLRTEIVSADSRQIYSGMPIVTATPTPAELAAVRHHLVGRLQPQDYYSAARFETDALEIIGRILSEREFAVMCGGSVMYVNAVCHGLDALPEVDPEIRAKAYGLMESGGIDAVHAELRRVDPDYFRRADLDNAKRLIHAIEISWQAGRPYSSLLTGQKAARPFRVVKLVADMPRDELFDRINRRVDAMVAEGLEEEARRLYPLRHLNALNTVGLKEMFAMFDGTLDRPTAIERIKKNTRVYAKKQLTMLRRDADAIFMRPEAIASLTADDIRLLARGAEPHTCQ